MARRGDWMYATPAQESYLTRLRNQAFALHCSPYWIDNGGQMLKSEASQAINDFKEAIEKAKEKRR